MDTQARNKRKEWQENGKLHRADDNPATEMVGEWTHTAKITRDGSCSWWVDGIKWIVRMMDCRSEHAFARWRNICTRLDLLRRAFSATLNKW